MNKILNTCFFQAAVIIGGFFLLSGFYAEIPAKKNGGLVIHFLNIANKKKIERDSTYQNTFGEAYTISKLKYYISNVRLNNFEEPESYHLIDAFSSDSFSIALPAGSYTNISFLLGVDSIKNCSGAQSGALDPLNDMFWTWNSGYVMFKLEGTSASSTADLHRIEQHIGGYKGNYKTMREINLSLTANPIIITADKSQNLTIEINLDKYWQGINDIKIAALPVLTTAGEKAGKAADNFPGMFSVQQRSQ
ncbi:MAG: MbnP family protein [Ferruginibacter sp.]